jgi:hypothetical protein
MTDLVERADELFPAGSDRTAVRLALVEELSLEYPGLAARERAPIVAGVIAQLEADDYFGWEFCGDSFAEEPELEDAD